MGFGPVHLPIFTRDHSTLANATVWGRWICIQATPSLSDWATQVMLFLTIFLLAARPAYLPFEEALKRQGKCLFVSFFDCLFVCLSPFVCLLFSLLLLLLSSPLVVVVTLVSRCYYWWLWWLVVMFQFPTVPTETVPFDWFNHGVDESGVKICRFWTLTIRSEN